ncbi:hypothetical protein [Yinghuangia sp. YIM S09857]|uniref:hypothetical protein n=1 Tax=Yinghuangia sp. YIM S09857 TaxID=3436929 RepID=UPI003F535523
MDLTPFVENLRNDLAVAAEAGGDEALALADRITAPLESSARLMLLNALSAAADEITRDLAPGSVDVRLRGLDPDFIVNLPFDLVIEEHGGPHGASGVAKPAAPPEGDEGNTSRINLRLPAHLKQRVEEVAGREGLSVNAWLVRVVAAAVEPSDERRPPPRRAARGGDRFTGWVH